MKHISWLRVAALLAACGGWAVYLLHYRLLAWTPALIFQSAAVCVVTATLLWSKRLRQHEILWSLAGWLKWAVIVTIFLMRGVTNPGIYTLAAFWAFLDANAFVKVLRKASNSTSTA
jgi:hypothetical protein